jgi:hypothetical protein
MIAASGSFVFVSVVLFLATQQVAFSPPSWYNPARCAAGNAAIFLDGR